MRTIRLSFLLVCFLISTSISYAKFCSECGKPLNEGAKFCSECGSSVNGKPRTNTKEENNKNTVQFIYEKLKITDEFTIYLNSSNRLTCMQKFPECKFKFQENIKELQKENLSDLQKSFIEMYLLKWKIIEIWYTNFVNGQKFYAEKFYVEKIDRGVTEVLSKDKNADWCNNYIKACLKCIELKTDKHIVSNAGFTLPNDRGSGSSYRVPTCFTLTILDINENKFLVITNLTSEDHFSWLNREDVYKRTSLKAAKNPMKQKIEEIDEIQKL